MTDDGGRIVRIHMNDLSVVTVRVSSSSTCAAVCDLVRLRSPSARLSLTASDALGITEEIDLDDSDLLLDHMDALASTAYNVRVWCSTGSLPDQHPARIGASSRHQGYLDRRLRPGAYARRWIVVHESRMHVYKDHRSTKSKDSIDLCAAVVRPCPSTGLEFDVIGPQGACRLRCGTRDDASEWVALIERQCVRRIHVNRGFHRAQALLSRQYQWADARDAFVARMQRLPAVLRHDVASGLLVELASAMGAGDLARLTVDAARALDRFDDAVVDLDAFRSLGLPDDAPPAAVRSAIAAAYDSGVAALSASVFPALRTSRPFRRFLLHSAVDDDVREPADVSGRRLTPDTARERVLSLQAAPAHPMSGSADSYGGGEWPRVRLLSRRESEGAPPPAIRRSRGRSYQDEHHL